MKRIYQLMTAIVIALFIVLLPSMVKAADEEKTITLEGIYITSPAGEYKTGDTLKFEARFSEHLASDSNVPTLQVKIGENKQTVYDGKSVEGNVIKYELTIPEYVAGKVSLLKYETAYSIKNEAGEMVKITGTIDTFADSTEITVNTPEWTDLSNIKYSIDVNEFKYKMKFENIEHKSGHNYYLFFTHNNDEVNIEKNENEKITNAKYQLLSSNDSITIDDEIELSGEIYFYIVEEQMDYSKNGPNGLPRISKIILEKEKLTRPEQRSITNRIQNVYMSKEKNNGGTIFFHEPFSQGRKLTVKIGKIEDKNILKAIKNKETTGMSQFLNYAKQQTNAKTYTITSDGTGMTNIENIDMEIIEDNYYYAYFVMDNENGKYVDVEDVMLYYAMQSSNESSGVFDGFYLASMNDESFKWYESDDSTPTVTPTPEEDGKDDSNTKKDDTTIKTDKLPQTGVGIGLTLSILLVALFGVVMFKKVRDYKEI